MLDRQGHLLGTDTTGPDQIIATPAWSPNGRSLVYATLSQGLTYKIHIWTIGHPTRLRYQT